TDTTPYTDVAPSPASPGYKSPHQSKPSAEIPIATAHNTKDSFFGYFRTPKSIRNPSRLRVVRFGGRGRQKRTFNGGKIFESFALIKTLGQSEKHGVRS
ncbi:MAG: hypothetical protein ACK536_00935, partial [Hyphomonadaceae bacterium]